MNSTHHHKHHNAMNFFVMMLLAVCVGCVERTSLQHPVSIALRTRHKIGSVCKWDPKFDPKWSDCCCRVHISMRAAAMLMILLSFLSCIGIYLYSIICVIEFVALQASAVIAIVALHKSIPNLLIGPLVLIPFVISRCAFETVLIIFGLTYIHTVGQKESIELLKLAAVIFCASLNVWFMVVTVKCRKYLIAVKSYPNVNPTNATAPIATDLAIIHQGDQWQLPPPPYSEKGDDWQLPPQYSEAAQQNLQRY